MKTRRFDKNYRPLEIVRSIEPIGSVPSAQMYDSESGEFTPDYTLVPLVLKPSVSVYDPSGKIESGDVTSALTNCVWYEIDGTGSSDPTPVAISSGTDYTIGVNHMLYVKKNVSANKQITLRFEADYNDTRCSPTQINHISMNYVVECTHATTAPPVLDVDCPDTFVYNPLRDNPTIVINARLMHGLVQLTTDVGIVWEKKRSDGSWTTLGSDQYLDLGFSLNSNGNQLTQDMSLMGERLDLRIRATYPNMPTLGNGNPVKFITLKRRVPTYEEDFFGVPSNVDSDVDTIYPKLLVNDHHGRLIHPTGYPGGTIQTVGEVQKAVSINGDVDDIDSLSHLAEIDGTHISPYLGELKCTWKRAAGVASGNPSYETVGYGENPGIGTELINGNGMQVGIVVEDRGPRGPITDSNGDYILDGNGDVIIDR